jgi:hypothetical protein
MNKVLIAIAIVCGLLLSETPEAAVHEAQGSEYRHNDYDRFDAQRRYSHSRDYYSRDGYRDGYRGERYNLQHRRAKKMPKWLKHDRSFRHWFERTRLRRNRHLSWHRLFELYRWENSYFRYRRQ